MILHLLRRLSLCLWGAVLVAGLGSFWVLSLLQPAVSVAAAPVLAAGLLAAGVAAVAWASDRLGLGRVQRLMRRAERAERDGLKREAETAFQRALGLLDGAWVSPGTRRRMMLPLAGRIARHYLSENRLDAAAEDFIARYLHARPEDEEVAEHWVREAERQGALREDRQDLADRLADAHPRHAAIQMAVARLCLAAERTDYPALQTYRRACGADGGAPAEFCAELERLFRKQGRSDEWSRPAPRRAGAAGPAPARSPLPVPDDEPAEFEASPPAEDEDAAFRMDGAGAGADDEEEEDARGSLISGPPRFRVWMSALARPVAAGLESLAGRLRQWSCIATGRLQGLLRSAGLRRALAPAVILGAAAIAVVGIGWVVLNEADAPEPAPGAPPFAALPSGPASAAPDQFALQVAAYLRQDYALKLVEDLKKKGLKAYWIETAGSGKTWYQVRIAPFPDPQSAREFGRDLKWKGVIDDFYVTSASR
jgi:hypothetical protein